MKAAFFFDTILYKKKNDYFGMTLTYDFFSKRYLELFDTIEVCTRIRDVSKANGNIEGYKKTNGNNVIVSPVTEYNEVPDAILKKKKIEDQIKKIILKNDLIIIRMPSVIGMIACKLCKLYKKKYMIEMVACAWDGYTNHRRLGGKILAPFMFFKTKSCVKNAPYVLYVTQKFLQKRYPTMGVELGCSDVELNYMDKKILEKRNKKISNFNNRSFSLCTVANVELKYKGHIFVLKAIKELKNENYDIKYYIAGNGNNNYLRKEIIKMGIENNVIFLGSLSHDEIFNLLDSIDVYVQPSLQEGLPRALVEAMSRGCPAIGSNAGGIPELINGDMLFKKKKYKELTKILKGLKKEKLICEAKNNFNKALNFDKEILDKKRKEFYEKAKKGRS